MKLYDISLPVSDDLPVWPGDPHVRLQYINTITAGDPYTLSSIMMGAHSGTHVDAPSHFLAHGKTVDALSLEDCNGPCLRNCFKY